MLSWIIQITVISIILIFLVHHLINFFKLTLTVPKIKDLVNSPTQKYENMFNIIKNNSNSSSNFNTNNNNTNFNNSNTSYSQSQDYTLIDLLPKQEIKQEDSSMKNELKNFLRKQINNTSTSTDILALDSMVGINSYSTL